MPPLRKAPRKSASQSKPQLTASETYTLENGHIPNLCKQMIENVIKLVPAHLRHPPSHLGGEGGRQWLASRSTVSSLMCRVSGAACFEASWKRRGSGRFPAAPPHPEGWFDNILRWFELLLCSSHLVFLKRVYHHLCGDQVAMLMVPHLGVSSSQQYKIHGGHFITCQMGVSHGYIMFYVW